MKYNTLGNTDIQVSEICLGTMTFGEQNTEAEAHTQLDYALDHGINMIDTAELYAVPSRKGNNGLIEEYIGTWNAKIKKRDQYILATKVTGPAKGLSYVADDLGFSKSRMDEALDRSLRRLQTDYIDLYQLHWPERNNNRFSQRGWDHTKENDWKYNIDEVIDTLNGYIQIGKIRHYGLSNETPWGVMKYLQEADQHRIQRAVSIQNPYNLLNRTYEIGLAEISYREHIGLLAYSPMAFGLLSGKYHRNQDMKRDRLNQFKQMARYNSSNSHRAVQRYLDIADHHNLSLAQMSLAYLRTKPWITSTIIGATSMEQLTENIASVQLHLEEDCLAQIEAVHTEIPNPAP